VAVVSCQRGYVGEEPKWVFSARQGQPGAEEPIGLARQGRARRVELVPGS